MNLRVYVFKLPIPFTSQSIECAKEVRLIYKYQNQNLGGKTPDMEEDLLYISSFPWGKLLLISHFSGGNNHVYSSTALMYKETLNHDIGRNTFNLFGLFITHEHCISKISFKLNRDFLFF